MQLSILLYLLASQPNNHNNHSPIQTQLLGPPPTQNLPLSKTTAWEDPTFWELCIPIQAADCGWWKTQPHRTDLTSDSWLQTSKGAFMLHGESFYLIGSSWSSHPLYFWPLFLSSNLLYFLSPHSQGLTGQKIEALGRIPGFPSPLISNLFISIQVNLPSVT